MSEVVRGLLCRVKGNQSWIDSFGQLDHLPFDLLRLDHAQFSHVQFTKAPSCGTHLLLGVTIGGRQNRSRLDCLHVQLLTQVEKRLTCLNPSSFGLFLARRIEAPDAEY